VTTVLTRLDVDDVVLADRQPNVVSSSVPARTTACRGALITVGPVPLMEQVSAGSPKSATHYGWPDVTRVLCDSSIPLERARRPGRAGRRRRDIGSSVDGRRRRRAARGSPSRHSTSGAFRRSRHCNAERRPRPRRRRVSNTSRCLGVQRRLLRRRMADHARTAARSCAVWSKLDRSVRAGKWDCGAAGPLQRASDIRLGRSASAHRPEHWPRVRRRWAWMSARTIHSSPARRSPQRAPARDAARAAEVSTAVSLRPLTPRHAGC
jgi:hypothetical protein